MATNNAINNPVITHTSSANTYSGIWASPQSLNYRLFIFGKAGGGIVFFDSVNNVLATANTASIISSTEAIPSAYIPAIGYNKPDIYINNNGTLEIGRLDVNNDGIIQIRRNPSGNFTGSGSSGFFHFCCFWMI